MLLSSSCRRHPPLRLITTDVLHMGKRLHLLGNPFIIIIIIIILMIPILVITGTRALFVAEWSDDKTRPQVKSRQF